MAVWLFGWYSRRWWRALGVTWPASYGPSLLRSDRRLPSGRHLPPPPHRSHCPSFSSSS